jgi:dihydroneopterin aldolase
MGFSKAEVRRAAAAALDTNSQQVMSKSAFETLEALANTLAFRLASYLHSSQAGSMNRKGWPIKIALEKPIAVVLADAACVQLSVNSSEVLGGIQ